jgi:hypothetical protein
MRQKLRKIARNLLIVYNGPELRGSVGVRG